MRYFFNEQDERNIIDAIGREFGNDSEAVKYAKHLAADLRCLQAVERPHLTIEVLSRDTIVHREMVFG